VPLDGGKVARSIKQEKRIAKQYRGSRTPMSGATWHSKNDVRTDDLLIEAKRTDNKVSITLKAKDLEELDRNAAQEGRNAWFMFDLNDREYVVLRSGFARELVGIDE
jgi:hypothetical protein